jgi:hypothetical protein
MFYVYGIFSTKGMKIKEIEAYWHFCMHFWQACKDICNRCREIRWVGATFSKVPAHYPDPGNPGHYMNVFKTPTTLNDGQQQPVDNFAPRANLKCFFKTVPFHLALVRWKKQQVGIFVEEKHMLEYIRHLEELQIVSMIRENSGLYSFDSEF